MNRTSGAWRCVIAAVLVVGSAKSEAASEPHDSPQGAMALQELQDTSRLRGPAAENEASVLRSNLVSKGVASLPLLTAALSQHDLAVQRFAVGTLAEIPDHRATEVLLSILRSNFPSPLQVAATRTLRDRPLSSSESVLLLRHENPDVRAAAVDCLANVQFDSNIASVVRSTLGEGNWSTRSKIVRALGKNRLTGADVLVPIVADSLEDVVENSGPDLRVDGSYLSTAEYTKRQHEFSLEDLGPASVPLLRERLSVANGEVRQRLAIALAGLGDDKQADMLIRMLDESADGNLRACAARSLGRLGRKEAIPALKRRLTDDFVVEYSTDVSIPGAGTLRRIFPVRDEAASSLRQMGLQVKRSGFEFQVVDKEGPSPPSQP